MNRNEQTVRNREACCYWFCSKPYVPTRIIPRDPWDLIQAVDFAYRAQEPWRFFKQNINQYQGKDRKERNHGVHYSEDNHPEQQLYFPSHRILSRRISVNAFVGSLVSNNIGNAACSSWKSAKSRQNTHRLQTMKYGEDTTSTLFAAPEVGQNG